MSPKMYQGKTTLGVITARGGSKGIPRKNIKPLCGRPLIAYTIDAAKQSQYLTRCIVSTDDGEIARVAKAHGAEVPFLRPVKLAYDSSKSIEVVQHALRWLKDKKGSRFHYVMILQPTSPLRTTEDIDTCIQKIVDVDADSVMSMVELTDFSPKKLKKIESDLIMPLLEEESKASAPRDRSAKIYKRNCAIYLTKVDYIMNGDLFGKVSRPYLMPPERSVDINTLIDFELAEFFIQKLGHL